MVEVDKFLKTGFFPWLESLSLLGKVGNGVLLMKKLVDLVETRTDVDSSIVGFSVDVESFFFRRRSITERAPLQTYGSALTFSSTTSEVRNHWDERLPAVEVVAGVGDCWSARRQTLDGHNDHVAAVAFSPGRKTLASGSWENSCVGFGIPGPCDPALDVATNTCQQRLEGHIADGVTTDVLLRTLKGHNADVNAVAFSLDGKTIASTSYDTTVRLVMRQQARAKRRWKWIMGLHRDVSAFQQHGCDIFV
ncbi:hypothetical protein F4803DRAFT_573553 [Xylaria telfairii]|nr:hypothetical protein F4803DRAFT_573553 [Xylaria telfairii]